MGFLGCLFIGLSIICAIISLVTCIDVCDKVNRFYVRSDKSNVRLWQDHGFLMTIIIMFFVVMWFIGADIAICHNLYDCSDTLPSFLNILFIIIASILTIGSIFEEFNINE